MAEVSTQQKALTRDVAPGGFIERWEVMQVKIAGVVLGEALDTPFHAGRVRYAQRVVADPYGAALQGADQIVMGINVINATVYNDATKTATCTIADIDLQSQIQTLWNALAGLDTGT